MQKHNRPFPTKRIYFNISFKIYPVPTKCICFNISLKIYPVPTKRICFNIPHEKSTLFQNNVFVLIFHLKSTLFQQNVFVLIFHLKSTLFQQDVFVLIFHLESTLFQQNIFVLIFSGFPSRRDMRKRRKTQFLPSFLHLESTMSKQNFYLLQNFLSETCPDMKVWVNCSNKCPVTCEDHRSGVACVEDDACIPGCKCPAGYVDNNGTCIKTNQCPCVDDKGAEVPPGTVDISDPCKKW